MECHLEIKRNEILILADYHCKTKENIILRSQSPKSWSVWFYLHEMSKKGKSTETESKLVFVCGWKEGK